MLVDPDAVSPGEWLVGFRRRFDASEAEWLLRLAAFDVAEGWAEDGQLSCADWLIAMVGMARATAFDKLRVARQLALRPVLAGALAEGRVSYCAVRAMSRAEGTTAALDEALVEVAAAGTVADVEAMVRSYRLYRSQEQEPDGRRPPGRGLRIRRLPDGMAKLEAVLTEVEAAEVEAALRLVLERTGALGDPPAGESSREDSVTSVEDRQSWPELQADALLDLARGALGEWATGADRYQVHLVVRDGECSVLGGGPVGPGERDRIACDCSHVTHVEDAGGVPLALGRRQRSWTVGQRRAVTVRDGGHCRWPGCRRNRVDIHHLVPWDDGGPTDVANALVLCRRHHTNLHEGFSVTGSASTALTFHRRDGAEVGTSRIARPSGLQSA